MLFSGNACFGGERNLHKTTSCCTSCSSQETLALEEREICTRQHSLGLLESIDLTSTGLLADIEILQQPIAVGMQTLQELHGCHHLLHAVSLLLGFLLHQTLRISLGCFLISDGFGVSDPLLCGLACKLFVLSLSILLFKFHLLHLLVQISHEHVHHGNHSVALLALLRIRIPSLRRRCAIGHLLVRRDLHETDAGASNTTRGLSWRQGATVVHSDTLFLREFPLWRCLVLSRIVELVHAILCELNEFFGCSVGCHGGHIIIMLLLADVHLLGHILVQLLESLSEGCNLVSERGDLPLAVFNGLLQIGDGDIEGLHVIFGLVDLHLAHFLLAVIISLLLTKQGHHVIDHFHNLVHADLLSTQSHRDQIKVVTLVPTQSSNCGPASLSCCDFHL